MANPTFKTPGIPRAGFEYQDLIGIKVLIEFYRDPNLYQWVQLDTDDPNAGSLDDIFAARTDGKFELTQVKFTVDPEAYALDWDWLTAKKAGGTSLLAKWGQSLRKISALGPVHSAQLRTNRKPSPEFAAALNDGLIDPTKLPTPIAKAVATELGGEEHVAPFFAAFRFVHSEPTLANLETQLRDNLVPSDTDDYGWYRFKQSVTQWATRKNTPVPDGKIKHLHLLAAITKGRPRPISQDFEVPANYRVPREAFHNRFLERVKRPEIHVSILNGPPGRGKSTYLSYLLAGMTQADQPHVRHHYFLSLSDSATDRVSFTEIATSMIEQMRGRYPEAVQHLDPLPQFLRDWISACGTYFKAQGKRFYVIVDGLDHVWREGGRLDQMNHLFNHLLPCPDNVSLIVGTQPVPQSQLPAKLLTHAQPEDWIEIPAMDEVAVHELVVEQHTAGRLILRKFNDPAWEQRDLGEVSDAFFRISHGHPLHLIYSIESAVRAGEVVMPDDILRLPECPDGDIRNYYALLWGRLSAESRQVLHLIAGCEFQWPESGLRSCVGPTDQVDHLLVPGRVGVTPFHGSILAYVRERPEHAASFQALLPRVVNWLDKSAPEYLRWGWLWIMQARAGDSGPLLVGPSREWLIESLEKGWSDHQIVVILGEAERAAFDRQDYITTVRLRSLKTRMQNAAEFQTTLFPLLEYCAIRGRHNTEQLTLSADNLVILSEEQVLQLARASDSLGRTDIPKKCATELLRRVNVWLALRHRSGDKFSHLADTYLESIAVLESPRVDNAIEFIRGFREPDRRFLRFVRFLGKYGRFEALVAALELAVAEDNVAWIRATQDEIVHTASSIGIDLFGRPLPAAPQDAPILSCAKALVQGADGVNITQPVPAANLIREHYDYGPNRNIEAFFYETFFCALACALVGKEPYAVPKLTGHQPEWVQSVAEHWATVAHAMAGNRGTLGFAACYEGMKDIAKADSRRPDSKERTEYAAFTSALRSIAIGVHWLSRLASGPALVDHDTIKICQASPHWSDALWIEEDLTHELRILSPAAARSILQASMEQEARAVTVFNERTDKWITLAAFGLLYSLPEFSVCLHRAADCAVAYGWRKDMWLDEVLDTVRHMVRKAGADPKDWIRALAPIINEITEFTDGDETRHFRNELIDLIAEVEPNWLPSLYEYYLSRDLWHLAEATQSEYIKRANFSDPANGALAGTLVERSDIADLVQKGQVGDEQAAKAAERQIAYIGGLTDPVRRDGNRQEDPVDEGALPDITKYGPDEFQRMADDLGDTLSLDYKKREAAQLRWVQHWDSQGRGLELLTSADEYFESDQKLFRVEHLLDSLFLLSLRLQGKKAAYHWLVRAHIQRRGWSKYYTSSESNLRRLDWSAEHYAEKWQEFIRDTSKSASYWEQGKYKFTIGHERLVYFLLAVGQKQLAEKLMTAFVELTVDELSDQPIPPAPWMEGK